MSVKPRKDIDELYDQDKLSDFEYNQLVRLNSIMDSLVSIDDRLNGIRLCLGVISDKTG